MTKSSQRHEIGRAAALCSFPRVAGDYRDISNTLPSKIVLRIFHPYPHNGGVTMEKRKPHYLLRDIKAAFADPATLNRSWATKQGADHLGMDDQAVVNVIQ